MSSRQKQYERHITLEKRITNPYLHECQQLMKIGRAPVIDTLSDWFWFKSLQIGDILDIFEQRGKPRWYLGTVVRFQAFDFNINIKVHYNGWPTRYDEWVSIQYKNVKSSFAKLSKLHSHTPYHHPSNYDSCNYNYGRIIPSIEICAICKQILCTVCNPTCSINGNYQCRFCTINQEENIIFNAMKETVDFKGDNNIILAITKYAVGYVINCSNFENCDNEISVDNQFDLIHDAASYSFYEVHQKLVFEDNRYCIIKMYGKYYRFGCGVCRMYQCERGRCGNMDTAYRICMDHPLCSVCNEYFGYIKINKNECKKCKKYMCDNCESEGECKLCLLSTDYFDIKFAVIAAVDTNEYKCYIDIINIIMDYSIGYVVNCCNYKQCSNEIAFNDRFALNQYKLCYIVNPKFVNHDNMDKFTYLHGKYMRFSCVSCGVSNKCGDELEMIINNKICTNIDAEQQICFNHPTCNVCKKRKHIVHEVECENCKKIFCDGCGLKIIAIPNVTKIIMCNNCLLTPHGTNHLMLNVLPQQLQQQQHIINHNENINQYQYIWNNPMAIQQPIPIQSTYPMIINQWQQQQQMTRQ